MTQKKVSPAVTTVAGNLPPSYEEANAGCPGYCYNDGAFLWDDKNIRRVFMQKVYSILMLQLFVTLSIVSLFTFYEPVRFYIQTHPGLYSTTSLLFLVTYLMLACCGDLRRQFPWNLILLSVFTLCMAFMLGFVSSYYNTRSVIVCLGITAVVCVCVTVFSFHTKVSGHHIVPGPSAEPLPAAAGLHSRPGIGRPLWICSVVTHTLRDFRRRHFHHVFGV